MEKNTGKVREFCRSGKVGTMKGGRLPDKAIVLMYLLWLHRYSSLALQNPFLYISYSLLPVTNKINVKLQNISIMTVPNFKNLFLKKCITKR